MTAPASAPLGSGAMFDPIAHHYDLLNRLMTLGLDQRWRDRLVAALGVQSGLIADIAVGTADVAIRAAQMYPGLSVVGVDPSGQMLAVGQEKLMAHKLAQRVQLKLGIAEALPLIDASVLGAVTAFGLRNFSDRARGLAEMRRITKSGGKVAALEIGRPSGPLAPVIAVYTRLFVPVLGALISGPKQYRYLVDSAAAFPKAREVVAMFEAAGLVDVSATVLGLGAVHLFVGRVP